MIDSLLGRSSQLWFQQMRRFQSLLHNYEAGKTHCDALEYRRTTWQAILRARGFRGGFSLWWQKRKIRTQGVEFSLPALTPTFEMFRLIADEYKLNYQSYIVWQRQQKVRIVDAKWKEKADTCFQVVKPERKKPLDSLVDVVEQEIHVLDGTRQLATVSSPFPDAGCMTWTLNGEPARVLQIDEGYVIDSDLVLVSGQQLRCHVMVSETAVVHQRLLELWNSRWGKHRDVNPNQWSQIIQFAQRKIFGPSCAMAPLVYDTWIAAVRGYKTTSARGPDGWAREDLLHMPRACVEELLTLLGQIEEGATWPAQLQQALIHCLEKHDGAASVNSYRPITLMSLIYRVWAGLRSSTILHHISQLCEALQCGFIEGGAASDIWYWVQTAIENAVSTGNAAHGVVGDLVKAYNTLPRTPVWKFLECLGVNPSFLRCWSQHLGGLQRRFVVRNSCSDVAASWTGFPEGCPLSCAGMAALDVVWHAYQHHHCPHARALSFVDNLELFSDNVGSLLRGLETMRSFCRSLDLELDEAKLYGWSTTTLGRKMISHEGIALSYGERDLGGQMNYGSKLHNRVVVDRIKSLHGFFQALRKASLTSHQKIKCISGALWPRGLHGCESVEIGEAHFRSLRTEVMKGMKWDRAGASPIIRVGLLHTDKLDPGYYQWWRCLMLFKRQCKHSPQIRDHWRSFLRADGAHRAHGPFTKLLSLLGILGWRLDEDFSLTVPEGFSMPFLHVTDTLLRRLALYRWQQHMAGFACQRRDTFDLHGYAASHVDAVDASISQAEKETLQVIRDGSFFTSDYIGKFAPEQGLCTLCGIEDSREHRYLYCPNYAAIRAEYPSLQQGAPGLTCAMVLHGLPGANPFHDLYWQALQALALIPDRFLIAPPAMMVWHVFTDGSCIHGRDPDIALASWALVLADEECIAAGWVPGIEQTVQRAELWAVLRALEWIGEEEGELHLWSDCQSVVETFRFLQNVGHLNCTLANSDLWEDLIVLLRQKRCRVYIHKVASHVDIATASSPLDEWTIANNQKVDLAAQIINHCRPPWFQQVYSRYADWWRKTRSELVEISKFHLAVAEIDHAWKTASLPPEEVSFPDLPFREWHDTSLQFTQNVDDRIPGWISYVQTVEEYGISLHEGLVRWGVSLEQTASRESIVSFLELFLGFRLWLGHSLFDELQEGSYNKYAHRTAAGEFRIFKQSFRCICTALGIQYRGEARGEVDLTQYGVMYRVDGVRFAWPVEVETEVLSSLIRFVGRRPLRTSQDMARPLP